MHVVDLFIVDGVAGADGAELGHHVPNDGGDLRVVVRADGSDLVLTGQSRVHQRLRVAPHAVDDRRACGLGDVRQRVGDLSVGALVDRVQSCGAGRAELQRLAALIAGGSTAVDEPRVDQTGTQPGDRGFVEHQRFGQFAGRGRAALAQLDEKMGFAEAQALAGLILQQVQLSHHATRRRPQGLYLIAHCFILQLNSCVMQLNGRGCGIGRFHWGQSVRVQIGSRSSGQVMQWPPPRPRPSSEPSISMTLTPASRIIELVCSFFE